MSKQSRKKAARKAGVLKFILTVVIIAALAAACIFVLKPASSYMNAEKACAEGNYKKAAELYAKLGNYKYSAEEKAYCELKMRFAAGDLASAASMFETVDETVRSRVAAEEGPFDEKARAALQEGDYRKAQAYYQCVIPPTDESETKLYELELRNDAQTLIDNSEYEAALEILSDAVDDDLAALADVCYEGLYQQYYALEETDAGAAAECFESISVYAPAAQELKNMRQLYQMAVSELKNGDYEQALADFTLLGSYEDAADNCEICTACIANAVSLEEGKEAGLAIWNTLSDPGAMLKYISPDSPLYEEFMYSTGATLSFGGLEWVVMSSDAQGIKIVSKQPVAALAYDENGSGCAWSKSSLNKWLNGEFLDDFTDDERARMQLLTLSYPVQAGGTAASTDYVHVPSLSEIEALPADLELYTRVWAASPASVEGNAVCFEYGTNEIGEDTASDALDVMAIIILEAQ